MRKVPAFFFFIVWLAIVSLLEVGCREGKPAAGGDTDNVDSATLSPRMQDTLETLIEENPTLTAADELFDDFFFAFAGSVKYQMKRIQFPLPLISGKNTKEIPASSWRQEHFYMRDEFYTQIFDHDGQIEMAKDTHVEHVVVEKINLHKHLVRHYVFDRIAGQWMMTRIEEQSLSQNQNASFLSFYERFTTDSAFLMKSINDPLDYSGPNPDDDFENINGIILPEQWPLFAPQLPEGTIYNILYGQKYVDGGQKIFIVRGIANGYEAVLTFRRKDGQWKLMKLKM